ncbi:spermidine putrescine abc transporter atpase : Putative component of ABC transporter OS=Rhizobium freirei PRF 81 GN=RHSP_71811 PE=3 SV=1: ABC_tran: TOBE_2 [Gemmata massiliana]|uniref:ABC transporter domain-containing protein n=1 Tax=Gemmata massiliana TaxID=1210884 RepID=A0A6P2CRX7_9BACT|nr:ABC transporter ATP-binding protein [Gemmata massiliana]VTR91086.1 spermidine putrescine abc transporter atpase : Putative component of ABC transporter OS=Rhizobium freirei PRF 81 GN=RHSP_71811 PE=3 SV=1: ABC_tran: TOBE_2 [Gemmata massiliana]
MNPPTNDGVCLDAVTFGYGPTTVVRDVSLTVPAGKLLALLGPSGCGKTTLLKLLGGYLAPSVGRVFLRERDVTALPPEARNAGTVFQNYALFPHLTARQNVAFGLEVRRMARAVRDRRVDDMLDRVGLSAEERDRKPARLSGGQQQRVALARALVIEPDVLLLDEPLANLDRHLRDQLRTELRTLQRQTGVTAVLVTHDQEEALAVSDLIGVMAAGRVLQVGAPADVYDRPRTPFVAKFLGAANLLPGKVVESSAEFVMIRPEHCVLNSESWRWTWPGRVAGVTFLGADRLVDVACDNGLSLRIRSRATASISISDPVTVGVLETHLWPIPDADPPEVA